MSKKKQILVVDDEPDLREILADEFRFADAEVHEAKNGVEAFELYKSLRPDAVVSDIRMPGGDGVTLLKSIKGFDSKDSRVFLITGFADITPAEAYHWGVEGFFTKPFDLETIAQAVFSSMIPDAEKWSKPYSGKVDGVLKLLSQDWRQDFSQGNFHVGRQGFFLAFDRVEITDWLPRVKNVVQWQSQRQILGTGIVRWVRAEEGESHPGIGIEFLSLSPEFLELVLRNDKARNAIEVIPMN